MCALKCLTLCDKAKRRKPKPKPELFCIIPKSSELQLPVAILQRYLALTIMSACGLIFCQHTWILTQVLLWCVCSIVIYTPKSQGYICSSSLAVFWTISFVSTTCARCSCPHIYVCQTHPWQCLLTHGVHEDSCNSVRLTRDPGMTRKVLF